MNLAEWTVLGALAGLSAYDLKYKKVFVPVVLVLGLAALVYRLTSGAEIPELLAGLLPGVVLLLVAAGTRERIGIGDGLVLAMLGIFCGMRRTLAILGMALVLCAVAAMILLVLKRVGKNTALPFLPYLCGGYLLCMLW